MIVKYHNYTITILGENCRTLLVVSNKEFPQEVIEDALNQEIISENEVKWVASVKEA